MNTLPVDSLFGMMLADNHAETLVHAVDADGYTDTEYIDLYDQLDDDLAERLLDVGDVLSVFVSEMRRGS